MSPVFFLLCRPPGRTPRIDRLLLALVLVSAVVLIAPARAAGPDDPMTGRVAPCTVCHGAEGRSGSDGYYPRIAGKPAQYLFNQLVSFRDGRRRYAPMQRLLAGLDDAYLREMADHFARLQLPYPPAQKPDAGLRELEEGDRLARAGIPGGVPACAECHGERLTGADPMIPGLLGLPRDYINAQIGAWREGQRSSGADDCMAEVARALAPAQVRAVSNWLASRPVPADARPQPTLPARAVRDCAVARSPAVADDSAAGRAEPAGPELARGRYLARIGNCEACHTRPGGARWAGGRAVVTPFGTVYSGNLTQSSAHGLGAWSFEDFRRAMRDGVARDGRLLSPAFPYPAFTKMRDDDLRALFAWLRTVPPVEEAQRPAQLRSPYGSQLALRAWRMLHFRPGEYRPVASRSAQWNQGAYLVQAVTHCGQCHARRDRSGGQPEPDVMAGALMPDGWHAPALNAQAAAGAGDTAALLSLLRTGRAASGWAAGPMAEVVATGTSYLAPEDALAIADYLGDTAPPDERRRPAAAPALATLERGRALYGTHCADCHGDDGAGRDDRAPALAGNPGVRAPDAGNLLGIILDGGYAAQTPETPRPWGMPPYASVLSHREIAAVASYVRQAWGNGAGEVRESQVAARHTAGR